MKNASSFLNYFENYLGRIEILGKAGRIERVYFEITEANIDQWEKPQIKVTWPGIVQLVIRVVMRVVFLVPRILFMRIGRI